MKETLLMVARVGQNECGPRIQNVTNDRKVLNQGLEYAGAFISSYILGYISGCFLESITYQ